MLDNHLSATKRQRNYADQKNLTSVLTVCGFFDTLTDVCRRHTSVPHFRLHLFRCGHAQQRKAVGNDAAHAVGQLQTGRQHAGLLALDAAGVVEAVEVTGQTDQIPVDPAGIIALGRQMDLIRQQGQGLDKGPLGGVGKPGGIDVRSYDLDTLRNDVAMVLQKNELFSGTIKENLRWGNPEASDEELIHACKLSCAHDFIIGFPDGYDHKIEQGGTNVSGGQKQRLCIARALLKKPKILILDDSTSAVDTKTDAMIRQAFREFIPETTKLIIAQRISSVQDADMIVMLDGGMVVAVGDHDTLMQTSPIYQEVYYSQQKGGDE